MAHKVQRQEAGIQLCSLWLSCHCYMLIVPIDAISPIRLLRPPGHFLCHFFSNGGFPFAVKTIWLQSQSNHGGCKKMQMATNQKKCTHLDRSHNGMPMPPSAYQIDQDTPAGTLEKSVRYNPKVNLVI